MISKGVFRWRVLFFSLFILGIGVSKIQPQKINSEFPVGPWPISAEEPRKIAPYVPTPMVIVDKMLKLSGLEPGEVLYDLGSGDGRIIIAAAEKFKARAVGVELNKDLYSETLKNIKEKGLEDQVQVIEGDLLEQDLRPANVVTLYLLTSANEKIRPVMEKALRGGSRVVSHDFKIRGWVPEIIQNVVDRNGITHNLFLYKLPQVGR